jgi:hypothetical protein
MIKIIKIFLAIVSVGFFVYYGIKLATTKTDTPDWTYRLADDLDSYLIVSYDGIDTEIVIEETFEDKPIVGFHKDFRLPTSIRQLTLSSNFVTLEIQNLWRTASTSLIIPEDSKLEEITCDFKFYRFNNESVYIPKNTRVCVESFIDNTTIKEIIVHPENPYYQSVEGILHNKDLSEIIYYPTRHDFENYSILSSVHTISPYAFFTQSSLKHLYIPETVTKIEYYAFRYSYLESIEFSNETTIDSLGFMSLADTYHLEAFHVPDSVKSLLGTFSGSSVRTITFGDDSLVQSVSQSTFNQTRNLKELVLPKGVENIEGSPFSGSAIEKLTITSHMTTYSENLFSNMPYLKEVIFTHPDSEFKFRDGLLTTNQGKDLLLYILTEEDQGVLYLDDTIETISRFSINKDQVLKNIEVHVENPYYTSVDGVLYSKDLSDLILYPYSNQRSTYQILNVTRHVVFSFSRALYLKEIIIPESIESIPEYIFVNTAIESVSFIGESRLEVIPRYAFYNLDLIEITIPKSVKQIGDRAFAFSKLTSLNFEEGSKLETIDQYAFSNTNIKTLKLPPNALHISTDAFDIFSLKHVYVPKEVVWIHSRAFNLNREITFYIESENTNLFTIYSDRKAKFLYQQSINDFLNASQEN